LTESFPYHAATADAQGIPQYSPHSTVFSHHQKDPNILISLSLLHTKSLNHRMIQILWDKVSLGKWFPTSQRIVGPSSSRWRGPRYLCGYSSRTPWNWKQMHYDPSNCQEPLAQWHGITLKTASFNSHISMTVSDLKMNH